MLAEDVDHPPVEQRLQGAPHLDRGVGLGPDARGHVVVAGGDVEVAGDDHGRRGIRRCRQEVPKVGQPPQLVAVLVVLGAAAVGDVHAGDPHAAAGGGDDTRLGWIGRVGPWHPEDHVVETDPRHDGDAVPAALAVVGSLVAQRGQGEVGEGGIGQLGLLEAEHVGLGVCQPLLDAWLPDVQRVDVPGGDAHG